jgi:hypothetical protein
VIAATVALALGAAACGAAPRNHVAQLATTTNRTTSPGSSGGSGRTVALEFSRCMRGHGVAKFPDLTTTSPLTGGAPKIAASMQQLGVSSSQFQSADNACRHLLPNGGRTTPAESQQDLNAMRRFAACMRSHGVPTWPDPTNGPAGWGFNLVHVQGFDPNSTQVDNTMSLCQRHLHSGFGIPLSRPGAPG